MTDNHHRLAAIAERVLRERNLAAGFSKEALSQLAAITACVGHA